MKKLVLSAALSLGGAIAAPMLIRHSSMVFNSSDSVPVGWYRRVSAPAKYIGFCLPMETMKEALRAGFKPGRGDCPGMVAPILKPVIHPSPGRPLVLTERGFTFAGQLLPNTAPKTRSRTGAPLAHFAFGAYTSGAWAVSAFNRDSFDSRYFGPINARSIRFSATPVLTW